MSIRAVMFDVYGTLLEVGPPAPDADARWACLWRDQLHGEPRLSLPEFTAATNHVIGRHHELARARGIAWPEVFWPAIVREVLPEVTRLAPSDQEEFCFRQMQLSHTVGMARDTAALLRWLKHGSRLLGVVSNAQAYTRRELQEALASHGLAFSSFEPELAFWSFEHGFSKPDPHVFQILTTRLATRGVLPPEILMVGDRLDNDIEPAETHGWQTWHLGPTADGNWSDLRAWLTTRPPEVPT